MAVEILERWKKRFPFNGPAIKRRIFFCDFPYEGENKNFMAKFAWPGVGCVFSREQIGGNVLEERIRNEEYFLGFLLGI